MEIKGNPIGKSYRTIIFNVEYHRMIYQGNPSWIRIRPGRIGRTYLVDPDFYARCQT